MRTRRGSRHHVEPVYPKVCFEKYGLRRFPNLSVTESQRGRLRFLLRVEEAAAPPLPVCHRRPCAIRSRMQEGSLTLPRSVSKKSLLQAYRDASLQSLAPASSHENVAALVGRPAGCDPDHARVRRHSPSAGHPNIARMNAFVVARHPNVLRGGRTAHNGYARGRRGRGSDDDLRVCACSCRNDSGEEDPNGSSCHTLVWPLLYTPA